jgi:YD repeat-containing protein
VISGECHATACWHGNPGGPNPVSYGYDGAHHVTQRTDAKGQQTQYGYDPYGRLSQVRHYIPITSYPYVQEQVNQRIDYLYDIFADSSFQNTWGRLAMAQFHNETAGRNEVFSYQYSYNQAGRVTTQRLQVLPQGSGFNASSTTSAVVGSGARTLQTQSGLPYCPPNNMRVRMTSMGSPSNYMESVCQGYSGTALTIMDKLTRQHRTSTLRRNVKACLRRHGARGFARGDGAI